MIKTKQELLNHFGDINHMYNNPFMYQSLSNMIDELLEQQLKTGHWEWIQYDSNPNIGNWHCSECRNIVIECANKNEKGGIPIYKYCPNCGARMESEDTE